MALKIRAGQRSHPAHRQSAVCKARHFDIAHIFYLIEECSIAGYFNIIFLVTPFQSGLVFQLVSAWLLGRMRLFSGTWCKVTLRVIRHEGEFAGFILMRYLEPSGTTQEIYMCAVEAKYRGRGLGGQLIRSVLESLEGGCIVKAECVPNAKYMRQLLLRLGFEPVKPVKNNDLQQYSIKAADYVRP